MIGAIDSDVSMEILLSYLTHIVDVRCIIMYLHLFEGCVKSDPKSIQLIKELKQHCSDMFILDDADVPWFPMDIADLDFIANRTMVAGTDLQSDHPGFNDKGGSCCIL